PSNALQPEDVAAAVAYVLASRPEMVVDEINLSPLTKVLKFTK
ncbi:MAG: short-chain dehydrogenase, partial [Methylococcaceae bacterium]|nr:short-chain dehydrogenase [Methylococcaceae bacterium]